MTTRVFLLDDHEVVRRGLRDLLETEDDLEVVGEASTGEEALARIPPTRPDVAVLDVRLGDGGDGVEVCREIRSRHPEIRCLMLTSFADDEALFAAIMAGASGYVLKQVRGTDLLDAVRRVGRGSPSSTRPSPGRSWIACGPNRRRTNSPGSPTRSAASSSSSPRTTPTARSPKRSSWPKRPSRTTSPTSWPNWA